jgi:hypothetical protein
MDTAAAAIQAGFRFFMNSLQLLDGTNSGEEGRCEHRSEGASTRLQGAMGIGSREPLPERKQAMSEGNPYRRAARSRSGRFSHSSSYSRRRRR